MGAWVTGKVLVFNNRSKGALDPDGPEVAGQQAKYCITLHEIVITQQSVDNLNEVLNVFKPKF